MSASKGFGKLSTQGKKKAALRKALREIRNKAKGKANKGILSEVRRLEPKADSRNDDAVRIEEKNSEFSDHEREWIEGSGINPEVTKLNLKSLDGTTPYDYLLYSPKLPRTNTGRLSSSILNRYHHLDDGGWWCSGVDVFTGDDSLWGCFKPDNPKFDEEKEKYRKYEHPEKVATEIFALKAPPRLWQLIARRYDVALPENYQNLAHSAFWKWVIDHPQIPIIITEGAKKAAAILSCGYVSIALPGIWNGVRQPKDEHGNYDGMASLIPQLQVFAQPGRRVYLCFDQDSKRTTVRSVNKALSKTAKLFLIQKCEVRVISWNLVMGKGIDDVVVAFGPEKFDEFYCNASTFDEWSSQQLRKLTYSPDMVIDQRYIGEILPPASAQFIAVKAPKNCGKTQWLQWLTAPQISSGERKTLLISHRIQLALQTTERLGIPFVSQIKDTDQGSLFGYGLVVDSLHPQSQARFNPREWRGAWVIIDEVQQVIWHLLSSSTCEKERTIIIKTLQELLRTVVQTGGKIFICDADLNDSAIDFIEGLLGYSPERFLLVNKFKFNDPWTIYKFGGKNPAGMIAELEQHLQNGEKALLCVSGQKAKSRWGSQVLEEYLKRKYPTLKILRIDSESVANPEHEAFGCTENLNDIVVKYDLVISSPTIETGVSIEAKHFDGVWLIGQGVQTADGVRQFLSRVRPPVPRYIWIKSLGINFQGNKSTTPSGLVASERRVDKAHRGKLLESGLEMPDGNFSPISLEIWAKLAAIINLGMWKYEQTILKDLEEEGHHVVDLNDKKDTEVEESSLSPDTVEKQVNAVRDEVYLKHRQDVSVSNTLSDTEFEKLNRQQQRKTDELLQLKKGKVERKYLVECTPDLIEKDDNKWDSKLRLHYFWQQGREYLEFKDRQTMEKAIAHGQGDYFMVDSNRNLMQLKVELLDYLGLARLYEDTGFHNSHPVVIDILEKARLNVLRIQAIAKIDLSKVVKDEKRSIQALQMILNLLGHKMTYYARKGKRGAETRYYSSPSSDFERDEETKKLILGEDGLPIPKLDGREAVFEAWLQRDAELKRKAEEEKSAALAAAAAEIERRNQEEALLQEKLRVTEQEKQQWLTEENLQAIASDLENCEDPQMLADIRQCYPDFAMKAAARLLPLPIKQRIKQWVVQQNAA